MSLLEIKNLNLSIHNQRILSDINFTIQSGKITSIVGESGSGKSVLCKQILKINDNSITNSTGEITFLEQNLNILSESELQKIRGDKISMIFQEPMTSLNPLHHIRKQIAEVLLLHKKSTKNTINKIIDELLIDVGLNYLVKRGKIFPHQLSGGERQRVMIAMALACLPKLIIADEPTTSLDKQNSKNIIELLQNISQKNNIAIIFITHDLPLVKRISDKILVMKDGNIIEEGTSKEIFTTPKEQYTQDLLAITLTPQKKKDFSQKNDLVQIKNLHLSYFHHQGFRRIENKILDNININIKQGETVGLIGESGSGKTSLAESILKLRASKGEIIINGQNINNLKGEKLRLFRRNMQIIFQDPFATLNPRLRVIETLLEVINAHKIQNGLEIIKGLLGDVNFSEQILTKFPHQFSGGERQRIVILRALCLLPKFIILDEPTASLDATTQKQVIQLLKRLQEKYDLTYLLITHDEHVLRALSHRVYKL
ncbi:MAG: ABC transporter ATP-binding protein [Rickettsiales bacterium]|nr:ABC transporter ATP-binding protein [Rickettsiales bacterium]